MIPAEKELERLEWLAARIEVSGLDRDPAKLKALVDQKAGESGWLAWDGDWFAIAEYHLGLVAIVDQGLRLMRQFNITPPPVPEDARERALHLRKHRNTGPNRWACLDGRRRR